jgi:AcrR family transcriptional regulator
MKETEERIIEAAKKVFTEKGYDATKTRDIAEAAGINISSLHYYFRSKEKLFQLVMVDRLQAFNKLIRKMVESPHPLHEKITQFVPSYIHFLKANPQLPMFILSEMQNNSEHLERTMGMGGHLDSLERQLKEASSSGLIRPISIENFISNLIGLVVFPFLSKPMLLLQTGLDDDGFAQLIEERKHIVPEMIIRYLYFSPPA